MNAAHTSGVFVFAAPAEIFSEIFFDRSMQSRLGPQVGKKDAIRFYRMAQRSER
jgi:hypothetical protein